MSVQSSSYAARCFSALYLLPLSCRSRVSSEARSCSGSVRCCARTHAAKREDGQCRRHRREAPRGPPTRGTKRGTRRRSPATRLSGRSWSAHMVASGRRSEKPKSRHEPGSTRGNEGRTVAGELRGADEPSRMWSACRLGPHSATCSLRRQPAQSQPPPARRVQAPQRPLDDGPVSQTGRSTDVPSRPGLKPGRSPRSRRLRATWPLLRGRQGEQRGRRRQPQAARAAGRSSGRRNGRG